MAHQVVCRFDAPSNATEIHLPIGYKAVGITQHPNGIVVWGEKMLYSEGKPPGPEEPEEAEARYTTEPQHTSHPYIPSSEAPEEESQQKDPRRPGGDEEAA